MTRNDYDVLLCTDEETGNFDWDLYQELCNYSENLIEE